MTLREQASERLTENVLYSASYRTFDETRMVLLDALQPLFDQVEREQAQADEWRQCALDQERDDLRAKLTQAERQARTQAFNDCIAVWNEWRQQLPFPVLASGGPSGFTHADGLKFLMMLNARAALDRG